MKTHKCKAKVVKSIRKSFGDLISRKVDETFELPFTTDGLPEEPELKAMHFSENEEVSNWTQHTSSEANRSRFKIKRALKIKRAPTSCHKCGKLMLKKNLKRHCATAHNTITTTAVCCDQ